MPWQRQVADVVGEYDPDTGVPYYREFVLTLMRQQGKTTLEQAQQTDRCLSWPRSRRQAVLYSAQTGKDARKKLLEDMVPVWEASPLAGAIKRVSRARGEEGVYWANGSTIHLMAGTESSGHGGTLDLGNIDEAFKDEDDRREQAMIPAMATRGDAQLGVVSTAGTSASTYLRRKIETGRAAAAADRGFGIAFFEWSVPREIDGVEVDVYDPEVWWAYMPAMGYTITPAVVQHAAQTMDEDEFRRAFCNQWVAEEHSRVIPMDLYRMCCRPDHAPQGPLTFGLDVLPDRSAGALSAAGGGGAEVLSHEPGTAWMVDRAKAVTAKHDGTWVVDGTGPAGSIADDLERAGLRVERLTGPDVAAACGRIYDDIADTTINIRTSDVLEAAVKGVEKRPVGDRFVWSRSASAADTTPLYSMTLAWHLSGAAGGWALGAWR